MNTAPFTRALDFEVYLLVTMKYGMINQRKKNIAS